MSWRDAFRAGLVAARRASIPFYLRLLFAWRVAMRWSNHGHDLEDAVNHQLSSFLWKKLG